MPRASSRPPAKVAPGEAPPRRLPPLLRRAWYGLNQAFRRRIAHLQITPDQYTVLRTLCEAGRQGLTQTELARRMASDPNTIASLVERMEVSGLLKRETDRQDRRARRMRLTTRGRASFEAGLSEARALQDEVTSVLPAPDRERFLQDLERVAEACQSAADAELVRGRGGRPVAR